MLLVFGCIGTDLCKKIRVLQHFSKSTRLSTVYENFEISSDKIQKIVANVAKSASKLANLVDFEKC